MLCEICQTSYATVHITGWRAADLVVISGQARELVEHHLCERCASKEKQTNPLLNPLLKLGPSGRSLKVKVVSVSTNVVEVKSIKENENLDEEHFVFFKSRIPAGYAVEGMEFEMFVTDESLKRMQVED